MINAAEITAIAEGVIAEGGGDRRGGLIAEGGGIADGGLIAEGGGDSRGGLIAEGGGDSRGGLIAERGGIADGGLIADGELIADGLFLVEVRVTPGNEIEVVVDSDQAGGLRIGRCVELSKGIEAAIYEREGEEADFALTVMSAGIGQPLKLKRQYQKLIREGKEVEVLYKTGKKQVGQIVEVDDQGIGITYEVKELLEGKKRKELVQKRERVLFEEAKQVTEFLKIK